MAKIINFLILIFLISCATSKKDEDYGLSVKMRDSLFFQQGVFDELQSSKDHLFVRYESSQCLKNWTPTVESLKKKLKHTQKVKERESAWFELGNCYLLVGKYKLALYYYDLVLGLNLNTKHINSAIYFNMGQIYENAEKDFLAYSYYQTSLAQGDNSHLSQFKLGVLEFERAEYTNSNKYFLELLKYYARSDLVRFLVGVNYYHLGKKDLLRNKVLNRLDEKSVSRILLSMALDIDDPKKIKSIEADLKNLEPKLKMHKDFKSYLLSKLER